MRSVRGGGVKVGYMVAPNPAMASYRLRVDLPRQHLGLPSVVGEPGEVCFFYKHAPDLVEVAEEQRAKGRRIVYDVVNDWFDVDSLGERYRRMCALADVVTCGSVAMARIVRERTGREAVVVEEPYENPQTLPHTAGNRVLWFGNKTNLPSISAMAQELKGIKFPFLVVSDAEGDGIVSWSPAIEAQALADADIVLVSGVNAGASANRPVKALRAGCFVVAQDCESYREFAPWISVGAVRSGMLWALEHPQECRQRVRMAQAHIRERFAPARIGAAWRQVFLQALSS